MRTSDLNSGDLHSDFCAFPCPNRLKLMNRVEIPRDVPPEYWGKLLSAIMERPDSNGSKKQQKHQKNVVKVSGQSAQKLMIGLEFDGNCPVHCGVT